MIKNKNILKIHNKSRISLSSQFTDFRRFTEKNPKKVQNKIVEEIKPTEIEWRKQIIKHRETELVLRGKKFRMQNELDNWLNKYDDFMEQQNGKIADVQGKRTLTSLIIVAE